MPASRTMLSGAWKLARGPLRTTRGELDATPLAELGEVELPGNLQVQLGYADLWLDTPELTRLNADEWHYTRTVETPAQEGRHFLVFDGIDYFCDVWVNGSYAGHHEGAFSQWELDVSELLAPPGEPNELRLAVSCPWRVDERHFYLNPSTVFSVILKNSEYMKGNLLHYWDGLPLSGNAVFPFGPWREVHLETRSGLVLRRLAVSTRALGAAGAELELHCEWWAEEPQAGVELALAIAPEAESAGSRHRQALTASVPAGSSETTFALTLAEPALWWTWDTGEQNLYRAELRGGGAEAETVFGVRLLERDPETLAYSLNGQRLFLRGVWYPFANIFNALPSAREHRRDVEMLREGGSNHFVSFTFIEKDALYDAADREGLLVFQELPYHQLGPMKVLDPAYPRHREYVEWSLREVENIVRQLRGHACVVVWAAFAETRKNEQWVWGDYTDYNEAIRAIVERADPDAIYHPSFCDFNEEHIWNGGFPFGEFWDHYDRNYHFISEFGAIAPPVVETLREIFPPEAIWDRADKADGRCNLPIDVEEYSYRWAFDYAGLTTSVARMYRFADRRPPSLERFVDAIQWYQALGLRYCAETYRRKRFADIGGCRTWSYRENVPGIKFTVVDHRQRPKLGYFGLQQGYAPLLLSLDEQYPLEPRAAGSTYVRDLWLINDRPRAETLSLEAVLYRVSGEELWRAERELGVGPDSSSIEPLAVELPSRGGPCLLRTTARRPDGSLAARADNWLRVVEPVYATPLRVLLLGQSRYNQPICDALAPVAGIELTVVDERSRDPQQSGWCEALGERYDVLWFAGWDYAAHQFRESEWERIEAAVRGGLGFVHTGGQASFHGGDGRGALLDATPLGAVLPVSLRPHDGVWDREPSVDPGQAQAALGIELAGLPFHGFSRTQALPGAEVHATIDGFPLLVTGRHGAGATAILTASFTKPLRMFRVGEGLDWEDPLDVAPHWARRDIRQYGAYWEGILQTALGLLASASGRALRRSPAELAEEFRRPLFEELAELAPTRLELRLEDVEFDAAEGEMRGVVAVRNGGEVLARLVRGSVLSPSSLDHRFRDGFCDLLPGEEARLRFEAASDGDPATLAVSLSAQNAPPAVLALGAAA